jgi:hypothetical protein
MNRRAFFRKVAGLAAVAAVAPHVPLVPRARCLDVVWHPAQEAFFAAGRGAGKSTTFMLMHRSTAAAYRKLLEADRRYVGADIYPQFKNLTVRDGE